MLNKGYALIDILTTPTCMVKVAIATERQSRMRLINNALEQEVCTNHWQIFTFFVDMLYTFIGLYVHTIIDGYCY